MFIFLDKNIFDVDSEAIVNPVNLVGVMGKGLALEFKKRFPNNYIFYKEACKNGDIDIGKLLIFKDDCGKYIINFPTKRHWRELSSYEFIEKGLDDLKRLIKKHKIKSISIPRLGCGLGGLDWSVVKSMMFEKLKDLEDVNIYVCEI